MSMPSKTLTTVDNNWTWRKCQKYW